MLSMLVVAPVLGQQPEILPQTKPLDWQETDEGIAPAIARKNNGRDVLV